MTSPLPVPQVVVRGEAILFVEPEVADLGVTVTARARDRDTALERCRARQAEVATVLAAAGDALEAQETTGVSIHDGREESALPQAVASVHTRVTVGRPEAVGDLVVVLGRLDDVDVFGPTWRLRPDSPHVEHARLAAVRDAVHRGRQYAAAFGSELTAVLEVRDPGFSGGGFQVAEAMASMARFGTDDLRLDLLPARQEVHGTVEVRFTMSEPDQEVFRG
ncbi:MAG: SIMPL domain-containing protein [Blastococcus sp.]